MSTNPSTNHDSSNPRRRRKKQRDLHSAVTLRPADVYALYGIPSSTLCQRCKDPDPTKRLPSILIPGRSGRKGSRLIDHAKFRTWLAKFETKLPPAMPEGGINPQAN